MAEQNKQFLSLLSQNTWSADLDLEADLSADLDAEMRAEPHAEPQQPQQLKQDSRAATVIQSRIRGRQAATVVQSHRQAATVVQSHMRGRAAKAQLAGARAARQQRRGIQKEAWKEERAATCMQARVRGHRCRAQPSAGMPGYRGAGVHGCRAAGVAHAAGGAAQVMSSRAVVKSGGARAMYSDGHPTSCHPYPPSVAPAATVHGSKGPGDEASMSAGGTLAAPFVTVHLQVGEGGNATVFIQTAMPPPSPTAARTAHPPSMPRATPLAPRRTPTESISPLYPVAVPLAPRRTPTEPISPLYPVPLAPRRTPTEPISPSQRHLPPTRLASRLPPPYHASPQPAIQEARPSPPYEPSPPRPLPAAGPLSQLGAASPQLGAVMGERSDQRSFMVKFLFHDPLAILASKQGTPLNSPRASTRSLQSSQAQSSQVSSPRASTFSLKAQPSRSPRVSMVALPSCEDSTECEEHSSPVKSSQDKPMVALPSYEYEDSPYGEHEHEHEHPYGPWLAAEAAGTMAGTAGSCHGNGIVFGKASSMPPTPLLRSPFRASFPPTTSHSTAHPHPAAGPWPLAPHPHPHDPWGPWVQQWGWARGEHNAWKYARLDVQRGTAHQLERERALQRAHETAIVAHTLTLRGRVEQTAARVIAEARAATASEESGREPDVRPQGTGCRAQADSHRAEVTWRPGASEQSERSPQTPRVLRDHLSPRAGPNTDPDPSPSPSPSPRTPRALRGRHDKAAGRRQPMPTSSPKAAMREHHNMHHQDVPRVPPDGKRSAADFFLPEIF